jgi:hypothetical protein
LVAGFVWCGKTVPDTSKAFCNSWCEFRYMDWIDYAMPAEFEVDVAEGLAERQMILG